MIRVVVIGLKIEGLLGSWVFRQHPHVDVRLVGEPPLGGLPSEREVLSSFDHTPGLGGVLNALRINYSSFQPRTGILLRDRVEKYPACFGWMHPEEIERVWCDVRAKARIPPKKPNGELKQRRVKRNLRLDEEELLKCLTEGIHDRVIRADAWHLEPGAVRVSGRHLAYDFVVITEPLWRYGSRVWFSVPTVHAPVRTIAKLIPRNPQRYRRWDQVFTPYTASDAVYRISESGPGYTAEVNGEVDSSSLLGDLNFLFPDGYDLVRLQSDEQGAISPAHTRVRWPENVAALGAYAEWRQGAGLDAVIDGAYDLMRRWMKGA